MISLMPFLNLNHFSFVLPYDENGLKQDRKITSQIHKGFIFINRKVKGKGKGKGKGHPRTGHEGLGGGVEV